MGEMKGKFANEEMYKRWKKRLMVAGVILVIVGIPLFIWGIVNIVQMFSIMSNSEMSQQSVTASGGKSFLGIALLAAGLFSTFYGVGFIRRAFIREIASFGAATVAPVAKDVVDYSAEEITPSVAKSVKTITEAVKEGIVGEEDKYCSECGAKNKKSSNFCSKCGKKFE